MKEYLAGRIAEYLGHHLTCGEIERLIETPPQETLGDFAFPCFPLARILRKNPAVIAGEIRDSLASDRNFEKIEAVSGYCNFFLNTTALALRTLEQSAASGFGNPRQRRRVVVEFASPNSNKPLHLGHLRNISTGESVSRILSFCGNSVTRTSINNDRGVHICKSMLAYKSFGQGSTPEQSGKKSDHFVGDYYVLFSKKAAEDDSWNTKAKCFESGRRTTGRPWTCGKP
jgi:arginyl-tRNA synthetase